MPLIILTYFLTANSKKLLELIFFLFVLLYSFQCSDNLMVEISGIEPLTYAVQVRRSPKLSYIPTICCKYIIIFKICQQTNFIAHQ